MASEKKKLTPLDIFQKLGVRIEAITDEMAQGDCPFCDKEDHLFLRYHGSKDRGNGSFSVPGHWSCKVCGSKGAIPSFLTAMIQAGKESTPSEAYRELWDKKRIPPAVAKLCSVVKSHLTEEWLIPTISVKSQVSNIHRWIEPHNRLIGCPTLDVDVLGRQFLPTEQRTRPLWIAEGHWDWLILEHLFRSTGSREEVDIIGVTGANTFKHDWLSLLIRRESVITLFDNDHQKIHPKTGHVSQAGKDGIKRIRTMIEGMLDEERPLKHEYLHWPDGLADGFDIRDLYIMQHREKTMKKKRTNV